jgi:glycosyltransferase involved in cell wall biosynthesis
VEAWAQDLGRALARRGLPVTLYKGGGQAEEPYECVIPCWQRAAPKTQRLVRRLPKRFLWRLGIGDALGIEQTTFAFHLLPQLWRGKFDIFHTQETQLALIVERARRLGLLRVRPVLAHGTNETPATLAKLPYVQHLLPEDLEAVRRAGAWKATWTAIPNFIDTDLFRPQVGGWLRRELGIPDQAALVLSVAAIKNNHKRTDYLLREFAAFRSAHPDTPAWLVIAGGREPETEQVLNLGHQLLGDRVRFLVSWPRQRMPELYQAADLFVLCSLREMFGIVLIEAMASGLPCLVHKYPPMQAIVGPGGTAIDMAATGALAAALPAHLGDPRQGRAMGRHGRDHCVAHFGEAQVVDQLLAYYKLIVQDCRTRHGARVVPPGQVQCRPATVTAR